MRKKRFKEKGAHTKKYTLLATSMMVFLFVFVATTFSAMRKITIIDHQNPQNTATYEILSDATRPENMLKTAGITLGKNDEYYLSLDKERKSTTITIYRAVPVSVEFRGEIKTYYTGKPTVGELIKKIGYDSDKYTIIPGEKANITKDMQIVLLEKTPSLQKEEAELIAKRREGYIETSRGSIRYHKHYVMEASAYLPTDGGGHGITASGLMAKRGIVAVDPDVIPLGTRLYVEGYGFALAADTGGMIEGHMIDLCMEDLDEALQFGRRDINVYTLDN